MTLKEFKNLLLTVTEHVGHGEHFKNVGNYLVWQEVGIISLHADNSTAEKGWRIAVDYFTKEEYDETHEKISALFERDDIAADDPVIDFEPDTGYTHYAWTCEVI